MSMRVVESPDGGGAPLKMTAGARKGYAYAP